MFVYKTFKLDTHFLDPTNYLPFNPDLIPRMLKSNQLEITNSRGYTFFNHYFESSGVKQGTVVNIDNVKLIQHRVMSSAPVVVVKDADGKASLLLDLNQVKVSSSFSAGTAYEIKIEAEVKSLGSSLGVQQIAILHCRKADFTPESVDKIQKAIKEPFGESRRGYKCMNDAVSLVFVRKAYYLLTGMTEKFKMWLLRLQNEVKEGEDVSIIRSLISAVKTLNYDSKGSSLRNIVDAKGAKLHLRSLNREKYDVAQMETYVIANRPRYAFNGEHELIEVFNQEMEKLSQVEKTTVEDFMKGFAASVAKLFDEMLKDFKQDCQAKGLFQH